MITVAAAADFDGKLTDTCTIRRYAEGAQDPQSGQTVKTWSDLATLVECRFDDLLKTKYEITVGKQATSAEYLVFFDIAQDITEKDRVTTVVRDGVTVISDEIGVLLVQAPGGLSHHLEVYMGETEV